MILPCGCDTIWTSYFDLCVPCRNLASEYAQRCIDRDRGNAKWETAQNGEYDDIHHSDIKHPQTFPREERTIWRGGKTS